MHFEMFVLSIGPLRNVKMKNVPFGGLAQRWIAKNTCFTLSLPLYHSYYLNSKSNARLATKKVRARVRHTCAHKKHISIYTNGYDSMPFATDGETELQKYYK